MMTSFTSSSLPASVVHWMPCPMVPKTSSAIMGWLLQSSWNGVGSKLGGEDGLVLGVVLGENEGPTDGADVGLADGADDGLELGVLLGEFDGPVEGLELGDLLGELEGPTEGSDEGLLLWG